MYLRNLSFPSHADEGYPDGGAVGYPVKGNTESDDSYSYLLPGDIPCGNDIYIPAQAYPVC